MKAPVPAVCELFSLGSPVAVAEAGGTRNITFVVETDHGRWVVRRRHAGYCDPDRISFDHSAARFLGEQGVPVLPPVMDSDGNTVARIGDDIWEAYPFAEGRHLRDGNRQDVLALAKSLARFHQAGSAFDGRCDKLGARGETSPVHLLESIRKIQAESPDAAEALDAYEDAARSASEKLSDEAWAALPHTLVHGDVQPANIIMDNGEVKAFLDLDWIAWRPRIYDFCFALLCCAASHEMPLGEGDVWTLTQSPRLDNALAREFLSEYERSSSQLTNAEEAALGPQMTLSWCHIRVDNCLKVHPEQRRAFLERDLAEGLETARYGQ